MENEVEENKGRKKLLFRLRWRGILLLGCFLLLVLGAFLAFEWASITKDYEKKRSEDILASETGVKNAQSSLSSEISGIRNIDLFLSKSFKDGAADLPLQDMGRAVSALKPSLHGIIRTESGKVTGCYAHTVPEQAFKKNMGRFAGIAGAEGDTLYFSSESYGKTRDYLEAVHIIRNGGSGLIFIYGIDNSYLWDIGNRADLANRYFIYDIAAAQIVPAQISLVDLGRVREELGLGKEKGTLIFETAGEDNRLVSYIRSGQGSFYLFNSVPAVSYRTFFREHLQAGMPALLFLSSAMLLFTLLYYLFLFRPILIIEKAIYGVIYEDTKKLQSNSHSIFYPVASTINCMIQKIKEMADREYKERILKKQAELTMLQSQINPHFLYNTLESIRALALREGAGDVSNMIKTLSNFFRYTIDQKESIVQLHEELKNVEDYLTIQNYRFKNKFRYHRDFDEGDRELMGCRLIKMMLQPIVENAIFHGLETKIGQGNITIRMIQTQTQLLIHIIDDGIGIPPEQLRKLNAKILGDELERQSDKQRHGIALINVNQRIRLYFGSEYGLNIYSKEGIGTDVEVVLPLIRGKQETGNL